MRAALDDDQVGRGRVDEELDLLFCIGDRVDDVGGALSRKQVLVLSLDL